MATPLTKTYCITSTSVRTSMRMVVHDANATPKFWISSASDLACGPVITLHSHSKSGPVLAASTLLHSNGSAYITLGDPATALKANDSWTNLERTGTLGGTYSFTFDKTKYAWKRTHDSNLGASKFSTRNFALV
jgi:hypothetical protein